MQAPEGVIQQEILPNPAVSVSERAIDRCVLEHTLINIVVHLSGITSLPQLPLFSHNRELQNILFIS